MKLACGCIERSECDMNKIRVMTVFGTRPEAIKMCPLVLELRSRPEIECIVCLTAQHRQMLDSVMEIFGIEGDYDLDIMRDRQTITGITVRILDKLDELLEEEKPDLILVHGDTSTTFASALAAFYHKIPVGHVEAGLRTYDMYSPFPEEMNRCLVSEISTLNFAPTQNNAAALTQERTRGELFITGNTVIDALKTTVCDVYSFKTEALQTLDFENSKVILLTAHRRENYGEPMQHIMTAVRRVVEENPGVKVVYPVHLSPYVQETAQKYLGDVDGVELIAPVDVQEMHNLMAKCYMVMTDSGGIQEEAPSLGKPVLVLRNETERPEAIDAGTVVLCGTSEEKIVETANRLIRDDAAYAKMANAVNPYGDGKACRRITDAILWKFGLGEKPEDFSVDTAE